MLKVVNGETSITEISGEISGNKAIGLTLKLDNINTQVLKTHKFMARIAGINIPQNKVVSIALTYIHGIGLHSSKRSVNNNIPSSKRVNDLTENKFKNKRIY